MTVRGFILCADDYALTAGVSRSILELLAAGRLSATGAMTNRPHWRTFARQLEPMAAQADLGVHLNLTCAEPLAAMPVLARDGALPPLGTVARAATLSTEARTEIAAEVDRQLGAFEDGLGRAPDFVDGHQHVHVLPGVRRIVLDAIARRYPAGSVYLRDPADSPLAIARRGVAVGKALVISALAAGFGAGAAMRGIPVNRGFAGVSPFDPKRDFAADVERFLVSPGRRHLVMCHPGHVDDELARLDPVTATRPVEHDALMRFAPRSGPVPMRFAALS